MRVPRRSWNKWALLSPRLKTACDAAEETWNKTYTFPLPSWKRQSNRPTKMKVVECSLADSEDMPVAFTCPFLPALGLSYLFYVRQGNRGAKPTIITVCSLLSLNRRSHFANNSNQPKKHQRFFPCSSSVPTFHFSS